MPYLTRSASLTGFIDLARMLGLDPYRLAAEQDLPPACLSDPDLLIPARASAALLEASAARSGATDFGLRLAETRRLSNFGAIGLVMREQPTLRSAIEVFGRYLWRHNQALSLSLDPAGEVAILRLMFADPVLSGRRQYCEVGVAGFVRNLRELMGPTWRPEGITFSHAAPADLATHRRVLGVTPTFGHEFHGVVIAFTDLDAPIEAADPANARHLERYVEAVQAPRRRDSKVAARGLIETLLPTGACSADRVAQHMGIDRRTLHRRLSGVGVTFRSLLEEVREGLAISYLAAGERSLGEIADLLGYSSLSAFSRWYKGRFGLNASAARKRE